VPYGYAVCRIPVVVEAFQQQVRLVHGFLTCVEFTEVECSHGRKFRSRGHGQTLLGPTPRCRGRLRGSPRKVLAVSDAPVDNRACRAGAIAMIINMDELSAPNCPACLCPFEVAGTVERPRWTCSRCQLGAIA
jgi:hypothetical protein